MKCPNCNKEMMTFFSFFMWSHPFTYTCKHCNSKLKPSGEIKKMFALEVLLTVVIMTVINAFIGLLSLPGIAVAILVLALIFYPMERYGYTQGTYTLK